MKKCNKCNKLKESSFFYKRKISPDGFQSICKECAILYSKKYFKKNREEIIKKRKRYSILNKNKISIYRKKFRLDNILKIKEKKRESYYHKKYGISVENKKEMLQKQNFKCKICDRKIDLRTGKIDHDHISGKIRALLCNTCNHRIIGTIESPLFKKAVEYLKNYGKYNDGVLLHLNI